MKILVLAHRADRPIEEFAPHLDAEAKMALTMVAEDVVREIYGREDGKGAVLVFEEDSVEAVETHMQRLPLVQAGLLTFDIIPVVPYRGIVAAAKA